MEQVWHTLGVFGCMVETHKGKWKNLELENLELELDMELEKNYFFLKKKSYDTQKGES